MAFIMCQALFNHFININFLKFSQQPFERWEKKAESVREMNSNSVFWKEAET